MIWQCSKLALNRQTRLQGVPEGDQQHCRTHYNCRRIYQRNVVFSTNSRCPIEIYCMACIVLFNLTLGYPLH